MTRHLAWTKWTTVCCMLGAALTGFAQSAGRMPNLPGATPLSAPDPIESSHLLGITKKKEAQGFSITAPAGASLNYGGGGAELATFADNQRGWGGSLSRVDLNKPMTLDQVVEQSKTGLQNTMKGVVFQRSELLKKDGMPAARIDASLIVLGDGSGATIPGANQSQPRPAAKPAGGEIPLYRQMLIVQTKGDKDGGTQYAYLMLFTPLQDKELATRTFDAMVQELELSDPDKTKTQRAQAIKVGREWLAKQTAEDFAKKIDPHPRYFTTIVNGKPVGFFQFSEASKQTTKEGLVDIESDSNHRKGVMFSIAFAGFREDGGVVYGKADSFWAFSRDAHGEKLGEYSAWNNLSKDRGVSAMAIKSGPATPMVSWLSEVGTISQAAPTASSPDQPYNLIISCQGSNTDATPNVIQTIPQEGAAPLPKVLEYNWPRFVDLTKPSQMTFVMYNPDAAKINKGVALSNHTLIVTGKKEQVKINGSMMELYKCIDDVDLSSPKTLWVDEEGRLVMTKTADQSYLILSTKEEVDKRWPLSMRPTE